MEGKIKPTLIPPSTHFEPSHKISRICFTYQFTSTYTYSYTTTSTSSLESNLRRLSSLSRLTCSLTMALVTAQVLGTCCTWDLLVCRLTLTTSKGLTKMASVTPAPSPASENVCKQKIAYNFGVSTEHGFSEGVV